jgi:hypothetical protein
MSAFEAQWGPIYETWSMSDFEVRLLATFMISSCFAVVETSREPFTKNVGFRIHVAVTSVLSSFAGFETSREPYTKHVGFRSHVACNFKDF